MKYFLTSVIAAAGLLITGGALAVEMPELAIKHKCNVCHAFDRKIIGPGWMDISKAYNSNGTTSSGKKVSDILAGRAAEEQLLIAVSQGGKGNWGTMPMPALDPIGANQADMKELVKFILGLAKDEAMMPHATAIAVTSAPAAITSAPVAIDSAPVAIASAPVAMASAPVVIPASPVEAASAPVKIIKKPKVNKKEEMLALSKKYKCSTCHIIDKNTAGPSWMAISQAYKSNGTTRSGKKIADILRFTTAENALLLRVSEGGVGNWGSEIMPANDPDYTNEVDMKKLIKLILGLAR